MIHARLDPRPESELSALDPSGLTPRMIDLAQQVMGAGAIEERIDRLEQHLLTQYAYTLDFLGRTGENPLEEFLFEYRSGHCEFFASAMVLMLRSQGVPARFVTGFLGAELNPIEDYFVVRQQNAHAWVEAYTELRGWRIYDPTPPDGRPTVEEQSLSLLLSQVYDYVTFRWDRYVLTYGAADQDSVFRSLREKLKNLWGKVRELGKEEAAELDPSFVEEMAASEERSAQPAGLPQRTLLVLLGIAMLAITALLARQRTRPLTGEAAYRLLRRRLSRSGLEVPETLAPLELQRQASARFPSASAAVRRLVDRYLSESFAEQPLAADERRSLRVALRSLDEALREQAKQERRQKRSKGPARPAPAPASV